MRTSYVLLCCFFIALNSASEAASAEIEWRDGYRGIAAAGAGIYLNGEIERGDLEKLKDVWNESGFSQSNLSLVWQDMVDGVNDDIQPVTLFLNSRGGDAEEAFKIGLFVHHTFLRTQAPATRRIRGPLSTYLGVIGDGGDELMCASSCAFIWLAGRWREGDRVAFHRPYELVTNVTRTSDELDQSAATLSEMTRAYFDELAVDERIFPTVMSRSREESIWVNDLRHNAEVPTFSLAFEEQAIDACGLSASKLQQDKDRTWSQLRNDQFETWRNNTDARICAEWELVKLQAEVWGRNLDEQVAAENWEQNRFKYLLYIVGSLLISAIGLLFFNRASRRNSVG